MTATRTARLLAEAAQRHDQAKTLGERQAASKAINDLILDDGLMIELAEAYLVAFDALEGTALPYLLALHAVVKTDDERTVSMSAVRKVRDAIAKGHKHPLQGEEEG